MSDLDDRSLLRLVIFDREDYTPDAIEIAKSELYRRKLPLLTIEEYWDRYPVDRIGPEGFCQACLAETTEESVGTVFSVNLIGTHLWGDSDPCSACGSIVQRKWLCIMMPLVPLGKYRVIHLGHWFMSSKFIGRKLK